MLARDHQRFVESATGGRIVHVERAATGASRATWLVDVEREGGRLSLVLRVDTGDGPTSGTELSLAREAAVYAALEGGPVRIPRLVAAREAGDALLIERAEGSDAFAAVTDATTRDALARDYFEALAELHRLDPEKRAAEIAAGRPSSTSASRPRTARLTSPRASHSSSATTRTSSNAAAQSWRTTRCTTAWPACSAPSPRATRSR